MQKIIGLKYVLLIASFPAVTIANWKLAS